MPASPIDSAIYGDLLLDKEVGKLFTDSAEVRAMMLVEGALAKVQGNLGIIPETAAKAIHRASLELQIDPAGLASGTGKNGVPVPALVSAFRDLMQAPEHAQYLHFGATSQDIIDTGLALRLRQALGILADYLDRILRNLGDLSLSHADVPMVARTYGQAAVPTTFGAQVATWGAPILRQRERLASVRNETAIVTFGGAAGTTGALAGDGPRVRAALASALGLCDPGSPRHAERDHVASLAGWLTTLAGILGKMGADLILLTQSGIGEVHLQSGGASSTMPQKSNPVAPSLLVGTATQMTALNVAMQQALVHRQQRDGAAWFVEWMSLPQMMVLAANALRHAEALSGSVTPDAGSMAANLVATRGTVFAEALTFALMEAMPRQDASRAVADLCRQAAQSGTTLESLARKAFPERDLSGVFELDLQVGEAPDLARTFAERVKADKSVSK